MSTTRGEHRSGIMTFFNSGTNESQAVGWCKFEDDFLGYQFMQTETGSTGIWKTVEVLLNTAVAVLANTENGVLSLILDSDVNAEDAVLYWGNQKGFNAKAGLIFEARVRVTVLPTLTADLVFGMAGDHNLDPDTVAQNAWFKCDGDGVVVAESDDGTTDNDDKSTGITAATTVWHVYRIDFTDIANVKFYIDGDRVASSTTFNMSAMSDANGILQPYFHINKTGDAAVGTLDIDYVRCWSQRAEV